MRPPELGERRVVAGVRCRRWAGVAFGPSRFSYTFRESVVGEPSRFSQSQSYSLMMIGLLPVFALALPLGTPETRARPDSLKLGLLNR